MNKKAKKIISAALAAVMCVSAAVPAVVGTQANPVSAVTFDATEPVTETGTYNGLYYENYGDHFMAITGCESTDNTYEIPATINKVPVMKIADEAFAGNTYLKKITFESGSKLEEIGSAAFKNCTNLGIGSDGKAIEITIPNSVQVIGTEAFSGCSSLDKIALPSNSSFVKIQTSTFRNCTNLGNTGTFKIPSSVKTVEAYAFDGCSSLVDINIPSSITDIGSYAFQGTSWIRAEKKNAPVIVNGILIDGLDLENEVSKSSMTLSNVKKIAPYAFYGSKELKNITFPSTLKEIGAYAFADCSNLKTVSISSGLLRIEYAAFENCTYLEKITIPKTTTSIKSMAFYGCKKLQTITILNGDCEIGDDAICKNDESTKIIAPANGDVQSYAISNEIKFQKYVASSSGSSSGGSSSGSTSTKVVLGDADGNGAIDAKDATKILVYTANAMLGKSTSINKSNADVNKDGTINAKDATRVLVYAAKKMLGQNPTI